MAEPRIERFRGDNYPITVQLTRDGEWDLIGAEVHMSFVFGDDVTHTFVGTVTDEVNKIVEFLPTPEAIGKARRGKFDVQVTDGSYVITHMKGEVEIKQDLTK